jgi:hypothetical protein
VGDDYSVKNFESDQCLNGPVESNNSNFQHCPVAKPIIASNLAETLTDGVQEGVNDLAEDSVRKNIFQRFFFLLLGPIFFVFFSLGNQFCFLFSFLLGPIVNNNAVNTKILQCGKYIILNHHICAVVDRNH